MRMATGALHRALRTRIGVAIGACALAGSVIALGSAASADAAASPHAHQAKAVARATTTAVRKVQFDLRLPLRAGVGGTRVTPDAGTIVCSWDVTSPYLTSGYMEAAGAVACSETVTTLVIEIELYRDGSNGVTGYSTESGNNDKSSLVTTDSEKCAKSYAYWYSQLFGTVVWPDGYDPPISSISEVGPNEVYAKC
jgi:hypothetical protein